MGWATWDFAALHRGCQIRVGGCGGRGRAEMRRGKGMEKMLGDLSSLTHIRSYSELRVSRFIAARPGRPGSARPPPTQALRGPRKGGVLCCKIPPVITYISVARTGVALGSSPGHRPPSAAWSNPGTNKRSNGVAPARQPCVATLAGAAGKDPLRVPWSCAHPAQR
jgi:hypothetical protein